MENKFTIEGNNYKVTIEFESKIDNEDLEFVCKMIMLGLDTKEAKEEFVKKLQDFHTNK